MSPTKKFLNFTSITTGNIFLAMWSIFPVPCKTNILEACVFLIALEDGTLNILHITNLQHHSAGPPIFWSTLFKECEKKLLMVCPQLSCHEFHMMYVSAWYVIPRTRYVYLVLSCYSYQEI